MGTKTVLIGVASDVVVVEAVTLKVCMTVSRERLHGTSGA